MINYSVIISQHNCAELTKRCILSIPEWNDIQIVVVDDNSKKSKNQNLKELEIQEYDSCSFLKNYGQL